MHDVALLFTGAKKEKKDLLLILVASAGAESGFHLTELISMPRSRI